MSAAPSSLEILQYLLQHMDANKRFEIYLRCPSLRAIERSVPLKIYDLMLAKGCVDINGTRYNLGIVREYNVGGAPVDVALENRIGGVQHEVDRYGIVDLSDATTVAAGDVDIGRLVRRPPRQQEDDMRMLEFKIELYEAEIAAHRERRIVPSQSFIAQMERLIEKARAELLAYQNRRDNITPNYEHFLQITKSRIIDDQEQKTIERYHHNKKYSEAVRQLTTMMFGGRSSPIYVTRIHFIGLHDVIRLPVAVQFHIEQLSVGGYGEASLEALAPILHESSYPLKKLSIRLLPMDEFNNPIVRTAGILRIGLRSSEIPRALSSITNPILHITILERFVGTPLEEIMTQCVESKRPSRTELIICFYLEPYFANEMEDILKRLNGVPIDDENVIIPVSDATQLKASYGPFPEFSPNSKWAVRFLTEAIEH
ncbi:unnamed protein product [Caenorhabditis brenneri]